jgi:hypothetical protein
MTKYPMLSLIVRYGPIGSAVVAVAVFLLIAAVGLPAIGWLAVVVATFAALLAYVVGRSYAELVKLVSEMLMPQ